MTPILRRLRCSTSGKTVYPTLLDADDSILYLSWLNDNPHGHPPCRSYQCPHCGFWHTTSSRLNPKHAEGSGHPDPHPADRHTAAHSGPHARNSVVPAPRDTRLPDGDPQQPLGTPHPQRQEAPR